MAGGYRLFYITEGAEVFLENLELRDGYSSETGGGGAIYSKGNLVLTSCVLRNNRADNHGGAIYSKGNLALTSCVLKNNRVGGDGGGINSYMGTLAMSACTVVGNNATLRGGGIRIYKGQASIKSCNITGNFANRQGGIDVYNATMIMSNCTVERNEASLNAGGIRTYYGHTTMTNCNIIDNVANTTYGGGVFAWKGKLYMKDCTISRNTAGTTGGGLDMYGGAHVMIDNSRIEQNKAGTSGGGIYNDESSGTNTIFVSGAPRLIDNIPAQGCPAVCPRVCDSFCRNQAAVTSTTHKPTPTFRPRTGRESRVHRKRGRHLHTVPHCILRPRPWVLFLQDVSREHGV